MHLYSTPPYLGHVYFIQVDCLVATPKHETLVVQMFTVATLRLSIHNFEVLCWSSQHCCFPVVIGWLMHTYRKLQDDPCTVHYSNIGSINITGEMFVFSGHKQYVIYKL